MNNSLAEVVNKTGCSYCSGYTKERLNMIQKQIKEGCETYGMIISKI